MNIQTGSIRPDAVTFIKKVGIKQRTVNFDIIETEDGGFQWNSATLNLGEWSYSAIVRAIIYSRYNADQIEAINSNITRLMFDAESVTEEKAIEYREEAMAFQAWRDHAKEIAKEILGSEQ